MLQNWMIGKEYKQDTSHTIVPCEKKLRKTKVVTFFYAFYFNAKSCDIAQLQN